MEKNKVYLVCASSGSWDGYVKWVHSVHFNKGEANAERTSVHFNKGEANAERTRLYKEVEEKKKAIEEKMPAYAKLDEDGDLVEDGLTADQINDYFKWWWEKHEIHEWNGAVVKEYEAGKVYEGRYFTIDSLTIEEMKKDGLNEPLEL